jgi:hypothetical protein
MMKNLSTKRYLILYEKNFALEDIKEAGKSLPRMSTGCACRAIP